MCNLTVSGSLPNFTDLHQSVFVDNLQLSSVHSNDMFRSEVRKCSDRIGSGHVRKIGKVFA